MPAMIMNAVERIKQVLLCLLWVVFLGLLRNEVKAQFTRLSPNYVFSLEQELSLCSAEALTQLSFTEQFGAEHFRAKLRKKGISLLASGIQKLEEKKENTRLVAAVLTLALGPFGAHRLYLGTEALVPVFYTITLGGGLGILPVIDLFHILLTKDLSRYYNHPGVFMWGGE